MEKFTGMRDFEASTAYVKDQQRHHGIKVFDDRQQRLPVFTRLSGDTASPNSARACRGSEGGKWGHRGEAPISYYRNQFLLHLFIIQIIFFS